MGLLSSFFGASDGFKSGRLTEAEAKELLGNEADDAKKERDGFGTDKTGTASVPPQSKSQRLSAAKGGATFYTTEVSPTDFVPNPDKEQSAQTPDYYRNGRHKVETIVVDGERITKRLWEPVPQLIADRQDPTLASIRLINPKQAPNSDDPQSPGKRLIPEFSKFFLTSVQEAHQEKFQTVETFNDWYAFFYGEKPPIYNFSGYLLNLANYNWWNEFMYYYQNFWRGTKAVELGGRIYLTYNYQQVQGYIVNVNTNLQAVTDRAAPFSISMIITKRKIFNGREDDGLIRDNLLPNSGLIDTNASATPFAQQLAKLYLNGTEPAKQNKSITDANINEANNTVKKSSQSTTVQSTTRVGQDQLKTGQKQGQSWASSLKKSISGAFGF